MIMQGPNDPAIVLAGIVLAMYVIVILGAIFS